MFHARVDANDEGPHRAGLLLVVDSRFRGNDV